ncbi:polysaccharide biosynthesis C-terminal domain-containing protein [Sphingobacterium sp. WQ 366]|uniref:Polysaccharide biosynthesis C-terminal domain-containing protein n=2 Tax=Sphingobacterium bovistauri TaxID=2781959 RepID=A0ABS7Z6J4_9SPHI|nr:polysaccharide biosynthesis C-terminal domain-containing protein [Sphingobacterium bovistauri]
MLNFILTPILVSKFATAQYGIFTKLFSYASLINAFLAFGMETTYFRFLQKVDKVNQPKVFNTSFFVTLVLACVFLLSMFVFSGQIAAWFTVDKPQEYKDYVAYVRMFGVILAADALAIVPFAKLRAEGRPLYYAALKLINIFIFVGANLVFLYVLPSLNFHASWFVSGWIGNVFIANLLSSVATLIMLLPQISNFRFTLDSSLVNKMLMYSFPIMIANISFIINENIDKIMIPQLLPSEQGDSDVGIYGAVAKIAVFLSLVVTAFRLGAEPFFFSYAKKDNAKQVYATILEYFTIIMVVCMVGITVNLNWLKYFIEGENAAEQALYWSGLFIVPFMLFNYVLLSIYMNLSIWYKLSDQTKFGLYISGIGAILTVALNYVLIPTYSYVAAVAVTSIVYLVMIGISVCWGQKYYPIPYKFGKIALYLLVGIVFSLLSFFVFDSNFWIGNGLLISLICFVFYSERKFISPLLSGFVK